MLGAWCGTRGTREASSSSPERTWPPTGARRAQHSRSVRRTTNESLAPCLTESLITGSLPTGKTPSYQSHFRKHRVPRVALQGIPGGEKPSPQRHPRLRLPAGRAQEQGGPGGVRESLPGGCAGGAGSGDPGPQRT
ncbi:hypothetical protein NDU88_000596 [Pleurodeles waltl]|uniref:Uncharacterized protein n=1 Tax=Pleurodeles waltl TaxID=8319 RepID=A0AAV7USS3_PLEWA|nr:hypothetical protein NDU88_000596 [Pleurodeles waltl]